MAEAQVKENAKWLIGCRLIQSLLQLIAGTLTARYLGPSDYGLLGYAASLAAFVLPLAQLGLPSTLVQELVEHPEREGAILGTALGLHLLSGAACLPVVVLFSLAANPGQQEAAMVCALYSTSLIFQAGELLQYRFHAKLLAKTAALAVLAASGGASVYKLCLITAGKGLFWFAAAHSVEYGLLGLILLLAYRRAKGEHLRLSLETVRKMLEKSRHYIAAGMTLAVFQNTDHMMLTLMAGETENGFYTAAITCAGAAGFLYNGILDAARPAVLAARKQSEAEFRESMRMLSRNILLLTLVQSLAFTLLAEPVVAVLYGDGYAAAAPVLRILVWYLGFSYMGSLRNLWILAEEQHRVLWVINLCSAGANVLLNLGMIPLWGARGAALASVLTQFFGNFILGFVLKPLQPYNRLLCSIIPKRRKKP